MSGETLTRVGRVLSSLWGRFEERRDGKKIPKYKTWSTQVEKKASSIIAQLKNLESVDPDRKDKMANLTNKLMTLGEDMNELLTITIFKEELNGVVSSGNNNGHISHSKSTSSPNLMANNNENGNNTQDMIRSIMLDLWEAILSAFSQLDGDVVLTLQHTVLEIIQRQEFDVEQLIGAPSITGNTTPSPSPPPSAVRYRDLLYSTLDIISPHTSESNGNAVIFAAKILAILHWRLPQVGAAIVTSVSSEMRNAKSSILDNIIPPSKDETDSSPIKCPTLISWPLFHKALGGEISLQDYRWVDNLAKRENAFVFFVKEWILHVKSILCPDSDFDWYNVPGFRTFISTVVFDIRIRDQPPAPLSRPYPLLELQYILLQESHADLITPFMKAAFLRTNACIPEDASSMYFIISPLNTPESLN